MSDQQFNDEPIVVAHFVPPTNDVLGGILYPVTIFQVLQAGDSLMMEGRDLVAVTLVAHVIGVEIDQAELEASFTLEDGTGRICADKDIECLSYELQRCSAETKEEIDQYKAFEDTYVEVTMCISKRKNSRWRPRTKIKSIHPVHGYHQVMYHILNVIHSDIVSQQHAQNLGFSQDMENMSLEDGQAHQNDTSVQYHTVYATPVSHPILPSTFTPQRHQLYATLKPLERAIMKYMHHHKHQPVSIAVVAQAVQESCGCTESQFNLAIQVLLSEAYVTSPLDDGYMVVTPRH